MELHDFETSEFWIHLNPPCRQVIPAKPTEGWRVEPRLSRRFSKQVLNEGHFLCQFVIVCLHAMRSVFFCCFGFHDFSNFSIHWVIYVEAPFSCQGQLIALHHDVCVQGPRTGEGEGF